MFFAGRAMPEPQPEETKERLLDRFAKNAKNDRTRRFWEELRRVLYGEKSPEDRKEPDTR